ncbi:hypothetical protein KIH39_22685 [Telmatocola sphagniphila]|uniref:Leucine Rich repeats (2 copies) n=1 Tax=Telmatocola sphagniphila TaxID=1123043 RepID=A0A8E6B4I9_9BACT|nr:hypothetical protein [Telmatocola sphagniphila]QVL31621.1 hypothetical protein KIH39_22685 [Telmatocola sphagniphila]
MKQFDLYPATVLVVFGLSILLSSCQRSEPKPVVIEPTQSSTTNQAKNYDPIATLPASDFLNPDAEDPTVLNYLEAKKWKFMTYGSLTNNKPLSGVLLIEDGNVTVEDCKLLKQSRRLTILIIQNTKLEPECLKLIAMLPNLESIVMLGIDIKDADLKALAGCKNIHSITIVGSNGISDAGVRELAKLPLLKNLSLAYISLDGAAFEPFAGKTTMECLHLESINGFTDEGAINISKIPNLTDLEITSRHDSRMKGSPLSTAGIRAIVDKHLPEQFIFDTSHIDDALLESLIAKGWLDGPTTAQKSMNEWAFRKSTVKKASKPEKVKYIYLGGSKITDRAVSALLRFPNLTSLYLSETNITDEAFKSLSQFKKLEELKLSKTKISGTGLALMTDAPIRELGMERCPTTEATFQAISRFAKLEKLDLSEAVPQGDWLRYLSALSNLKELSLSKINFSDANAKLLSSLAQLEDLNLNYSQLGDGGFRELLKLPKLKQFYLYGTKVTDKAFLQAQKDHPKLNLNK